MADHRPPGFMRMLRRAREIPARTFEAVIPAEFVTAYNELVTGSPVDTGLYRSAHLGHRGTQVPLVVIPYGPHYPRRPDAQARAVVRGFKLGWRVAIANHAKSRKGFPYGVMIEPPRTISPQAPQGVYAVVRRNVRKRLPGTLRRRMRREIREVAA